MLQNIQVICDVTRRRLSESYRCFEVLKCLHVRSQAVNSYPIALPEDWGITILRKLGKYVLPNTTQHHISLCWCGLDNKKSNL